MAQACIRPETGQDGRVKTKLQLVLWLALALVGCATPATRIRENPTLFASFPPEVQAKLLRVLENQEVRRVGSNKSEKVNFRLISATNRNLAERVRLGLFREDLYYRINVLTIRMPALRDRRDDIPHLVRHFSKLRVSHSALEKLCGHDWPGNLRQLRNVIVRAEVLHDTGELDEHHLDFGD